MPSTCRHEYRRVGVVEISSEAPPRYVPPMLSSRSRYVVKVHKTWERLNKGKAIKSAYARALIEAKELLRTLIERGVGIKLFKRNCRLTLDICGRRAKAWRVPGTPEHGHLIMLERTVAEMFQSAVKHKNF